MFKQNILLYKVYFSPLIECHVRKWFFFSRQRVSFHPKTHRLIWVKIQSMRASHNTRSFCWFLMGLNSFVCLGIVIWAENVQKLGPLDACPSKSCSRHAFLGFILLRILIRSKINGGSKIPGEIRIFMCKHCVYVGSCRGVLLSILSPHRRYKYHLFNIINEFLTTTINHSMVLIPLPNSGSSPIKEVRVHPLRIILFIVPNNWIFFVSIRKFP